MRSLLFGVGCCGTKAQGNRGTRPSRHKAVAAQGRRGARGDKRNKESLVFPTRLIYSKITQGSPQDTLGPQMPPKTHQCCPRTPQNSKNA